MEAWALMWININIYSYNSDISEKLSQLLFSNKTTTQKIAVLISEKLQQEHGIRFDAKIRRRIKYLRSSITAVSQYPRNSQRANTHEAIRQGVAAGGGGGSCPSTFFCFIADIKYIILLYCHSHY